MLKDRELILAGMNVPELLDRLMGNEKLVGLFVKKFLEDANYPKLIAAVQQEDWPAAEMASHTLKGMCGNLSLKELFGLFDCQVRHFRAGEEKKAVEMMAQITAAYDNAVTHLNLWLAEQ